MFEPGPWDTRAQSDGAHVFSKKRKLLYGNDHDKAEFLEGEVAADAHAYGQREKHHKHDMWRRGAMRMLEELARKEKGEARVYKVSVRSGKPPWPGDLGKHHAIVEEMIDMGVLSVHTDDSANTYARVHREKLRDVAARFKAEAERTSKAAAAPSKPPGVAAPVGAAPFVSAAGFGGARSGYVFKSGEQGLGYYLDGGSSGGSSVAARGAAAVTPLPDGWVQGATPEGYVYYWHTPTSTSSWERPTGPPPVTREVVVPAQVAAALQAAGRKGLNAVQQDSGATVLVHAAGVGAQAAVTVSGPQRSVERACQLLQRKVDAHSYAARALPASACASTGAVAARAARDDASLAAGPDYDFSAVGAAPAPPPATASAGPASAPVARQPASALAAVAQYDDDDDDE